MVVCYDVYFSEWQINKPSSVQVLEENAMHIRTINNQRYSAIFLITSAAFEKIRLVSLDYWRFIYSALLDYIIILSCHSDSR